MLNHSDPALPAALPKESAMAALVTHTGASNTEPDAALWDVGTPFLLLLLQHTGAALSQQIHAKPGPFHLSMQSWKFSFLSSEA